MSKIYRVHTISLGCPKNRVDTENVLGGLPFATTPAATPEAADLVVVNTCSFIAPAVEESVAAILEASEAIRELSPRPVLAVLGCLPSRFGQE